MFHAINVFHISILIPRFSRGFFVGEPINEADPPFGQFRRPACKTRKKNQNCGKSPDFDNLQPVSPRTLDTFKSEHLETPFISLGRGDKF